MKMNYWAGSAAAVLLSLAAYLFQLPFAATPAQTAALILITVGLWTVIAAFLVVEKKDRTFFAGWGLLLALLSLFAYLQPAYALGLLLIAVVLLIVAMAYAGRSRGMLTAAAGPPTTAGETPAAKQLKRLP